MGEYYLGDLPYDRGPILSIPEKDLNKLYEENKQMRKALEKIVSYKLFFDYVSLGPDGPHPIHPGRPYDRGKADMAETLVGIAQKGLTGGSEYV